MKQAKRKKIWLANAIVLLLLALLFAILPFTGKTASVKTVSAANQGFTYEGASPTVSENAFGTQFSSSNAFKVKTDRIVYMDKMGFAGTFNENGCESFDIIFTSVQNEWYANSSTAHYVKLALTYKHETAANVSVIVDNETIATGSIGVYWVYETSTQVASDRTVITLTKTDGKNIEDEDNKYGGWVLQGMDQTQLFMDATANAKLDGVLQYFENGNGYLQFASNGGRLDLTFLGVVYGSQMLDANYKDFDDDFITYKEFGSLTHPTYGYTSGDEKLSLYAPNNGATEWYVSSKLAMPLNGFNLTMRLAHGEKLWKTAITAFSRHSHDWYKGSYSVGIEVTWDPSAPENERTTLDFLYYTDNTIDKSVVDGGAGFYPSSGFREDPRKLSVSMPDSAFPWFEDFEFSIEKTRGKWAVTLNGINYWEDVEDIEAEKTVNHYLEQASAYFADNRAHLVMGCENLRPYDGATKIDYVGGFANVLIKDWVLLESAGNPVTVNEETAMQFDGLELTTMQTVEISLTDLFIGGSGELIYTSTKGLIVVREELGQTVLLFTADMAGTYYVTVTAFDGVTRTDRRFTFYFTGDPVFVQE